MFSRIHDRLGTAGLVVAVIALIAALSGTALAAVGLNGKQKKEVTKIAKKYAGQPGAPGTAGPAGAPGAAGTAGAKGDKGDAGARGEDGTDGTPGTPGADGKTILSGTTAPAAGTGTNGDFYIRTSTSEIYGPKTAGVWGAPTSLLGDEGPEGPAGSPWVVGEAPSKVILKGTWSVPQYTAAAAGENIPVPLSTGVPVPETSSSFIGAAVGGGLSNGEEEGLATTVCPGSAESPTINSGLLETMNVGGVCVYAAAQTNLAPPPPGGPGSGTFALTSSGGGAVTMLKSGAAGAATGYGSWVMFTAP
jgi:hypothetical protein